MSLHEIEAILFAVGNKISVEELMQLTASSKKQVLKYLRTLQETYKQQDGALVIFDEGNFWKLTVKEAYAGVVQKIIARTELSKATMETLAILAWKAPMKQSELIDIRSASAYEHLAELEQAGFITREKSGRTYVLRLTQKFSDYFELHSKEEREKLFGTVHFPSQKHVDDFESVEEQKEQVAEDRTHEFDHLAQTLSQEAQVLLEQDKDFLGEIDNRIDKVSKESEKTKNEIKEII
ncbi:MAG: SMC-Scp complex subunit ScpB [Candidatus Woesearchaeota archaeon]